MYLNSDLDWKLTCVGNAESEDDDQILEEIYVGPNLKGVHMFALQTSGTSHQMIKNKDIIGVSVFLVTCKAIVTSLTSIKSRVSLQFLPKQVAT